jgi:hypothetical protein
VGFFLFRSSPSLLNLSLHHLSSFFLLSLHSFVSYLGPQDGIMRLSTFVSGLVALLPAVHSLSTTDSPQDGDVLQSGYSSNHNLDPTKLSSYVLKWKYSTGTASEFFYAKPLVYTPIGASYERMYVVSDMNIVRVLDASTGNVLLSRTLLPPFKSTDTQCGDIPNQVGIIGTPIIDPATEIMYFWSKSYKNGQVGPLGTPKTGADNSKTGVANGSLHRRVLPFSRTTDLKLRRQLAAVRYISGGSQ